MALGGTGRIRQCGEVSREEAHRRPAASSTPVAPGPHAAERTTEGAVGQQCPLFTARTDQAAGTIRARGHVDQVGAEALCRIVTALQQAGHRQIAVELGSATVAGDARALLADHARQLGTEGVRVVLW
jgi:hypothetical protein